MTESYRIRPAKPEDAPAIGALSRQVFRQTFVDEFGIPYAPADLEDFLATSHGDAKFASQIGSDIVLVAEGEDGLWGYASGGACDLPHPDVTPGDVELYRLYVHFDRHGGGVAGALMDAFIATANPDGGKVMWLGVWSENYRAQKFYARHGFGKVGEYDYPVGETIDREFILRRLPNKA